MLFENQCADIFKSPITIELLLCDESLLLV